MLRKFEPYFGDFLKKIHPEQNQKFSYKKTCIVIKWQKVTKNVIANLPPHGISIWNFNDLSSVNLWEIDRFLKELNEFEVQRKFHW